jgi:hypothetical protein
VIYDECADDSCSEGESPSAAVGSGAAYFIDDVSLDRGL